MDLILPFKVGDVVETRSYNVGYRGAWFRCKITDMCIRSGHMECQVEYIDYPDERRKWNRLFKIPPKCRNQKASQNREIMLRPPFPRWCWENDIAELGPQTDVVAVVSSPWKVGDLIDWWYTDCFWTGKITELMSDDKVKVIIYYGEH
uniref:Agenet-like domain-containing protein n=1 Tax=Triticum urartu TaxID=4572 RepID=A0A8R7PWY7_TRIUA